MRHGAKRKPEGAAHDALRFAAVGLEAEFTLVVDGTPLKPEDLFVDPRGFIRAPLMHRVGTSYHLPNSCAVYFDTGVIELATPAMELERGAVARAGRSLWEAIALVRTELDLWQRRSGRSARLTGFSTHYNTSLSAGERRSIPHAHLNRVAQALTSLLPAPVMLIATNRESTGVGVRPRRNRIEITVDFTPDPALMIAAASLAIGIVRDVLTWRAAALDRVDREVPVIRGFAPMRHTSRKGWLARWDCYPANPFTCDVDADVWQTTAGPMTLREIAGRVFDRFARAIARVADPLSLRLISSLLAPGGASMLTLPERPAAYEDVGHGSVWNADHMTRSRYERVMMHAVAGRPLRLFGGRCTPVRVRGWSAVVFRRDADGSEFVIPIDLLVGRLDEWKS